MKGPDTRYFLVARLTAHTGGNDHGLSENTAKGLDLIEEHGFMAQGQPLQ